MSELLLREDQAPKAFRGGSRQTIPRLAMAIADLGEKGGSSASSIGKALARQHGHRCSSSELKRLLIRAVRTGKVRQAPRNRFILEIPANFSRTERVSPRGRGRRRRRRRGKGKGKGKGKGRGRGRRRRRRRGRRGKGKGKGKGRKGRRRRRRRRRRGKGKGKR